MNLCCDPGSLKSSPLGCHSNAHRILMSRHVVLPCADVDGCDPVISLNSFTVMFNNSLAITAENYFAVLIHQDTARWVI